MCSRNLKISVVLILVLVPLISTVPHSMSRRKRDTFFDLECKGTFNKALFYRLDRICEDCYQLFRETTVHRLCKESCFTTQYFKACVDALHLNDEIETIKFNVKHLNGVSWTPQTPSQSKA
ncbi:ion transport peptide-like isoform X1 [Condylostylus longicornis]|uniref:ion transport peptide-like isoform X1 n=1 Tax=Condylostylus longicornis TaxID=2530218 RepID=UPI00244DAB78|nr:ion transport peptide-like isoform X1 [Condylostylus longicornis]XP_055379662.1 ion transport peptide-like isoform X1 [Condylostylus longicornis]XP_055379663.1 ion transport peptide-like isoform X1 [Condylostylus longicornis]XP_055379665.1 ion transport peptide-like isoform X1 [Condylostylus longicornis]XP_055379666.1 ion transport peptide-like isoform X1 [Condylostylus longicornis]